MACRLIKNPRIENFEWVNLIVCKLSINNIDLKRKEKNFQPPTRKDEIRS